MKLTDGRLLEFPMSEPWPSPTSAVAEVHFDFELNAIRLVTTRAEDVNIELPTVSDMAPRKNRLAVYLDQKDWSGVACQLAEGVGTNGGSAEELASLVRSQEVILPISSAHMSETAKWSVTELRYRQALIMAQLGGGWQLRDPLAVRVDEVARLMSKTYGKTCHLERPAVTLEPNSIFAARRPLLPSRPLEWAIGLPVEWQFPLLCIKMAIGVLDAILDFEATPMSAAAGWAEHCQKFTDQLSAEKNSNKIEIRVKTFDFFIRDLHPELSEAAHLAGLSADELHDFVVSQLRRSMNSMPSLSYYYELLHHKLSSGTQNWSTNDLIDMMDLSCAAAYCDFVVCERSTAASLGQASKRLARPLAVYKNLDLAMADISNRTAPVSAMLSGTADA